MGGFNLSSWALAHRSFVTLILVLAALAGGLSYLRLGRSEDPSFTIKTMVLQANWPGATMDDTLHQVTDRLERKLQELQDLDNLKSLTTPGQTIIYVTLSDATPPERVDDDWYQVRKKVADMGRELPSGVLGPFFNDEFGDTYGIIYAFTADPGFSERELRDVVDAARDRVLRLPGIGKAELIGTQDEKIWIEFSTRRLASLGIDPEAVIAQIQNQNAVVPAGEIVTSADSTRLEVTGAFGSEAEIDNLTIATQSGVVRLDDIATVRRGPVDPAQPMFRVAGQPAIGLAMSMKEGGDVLALGQQIDTVIAQVKSGLPIGMEVSQVSNQTAVVQHAVSGFTRALTEAVVIVLAVSFIALGLRAGLVVFVSIPLSLMLVFLAMELYGIALQRVSLGALIIALGLLVDDAMITVEMMVSKLEEGMEKAKAAAYAWTSTAFPMLTGTLVTVAGFVPVGFAKSAAGEYANSLFWVIAFALILSWIVAVLASPIVGVWVLPARIKRKHEGEGRYVAAFRRFLTRALHWRWPIVIGTLLLFALSILGAMRLPQQFFPPSDRPELLLDLNLPQSSSIERTRQVVTEVEKIVAAEAEVESFSFYVGEGAIRFYLPMDVLPPASYTAQGVLVTTADADRPALTARLQRVLDDRFPDVLSRVAPLELGPPVGWPVQIRVSGEDLGAVRDLAWQVADVMGAAPGAVNVNLDWNEPARLIRIRVDQDRARLVGLSSAQLAQALLAVTSGVNITQIRDDIYLVDVVGRGAENERRDVDTLLALQIPLGGGRTVPLISVASFDYATSQPVVWRRDRLPTITVRADVVNITAEAMAAGIAPAIDRLAAANPEMRLETGGVVEESEKGLGSVVAVFPLMVILILVILMAQLQSVQLLILVLSVVPLGLIGVVAALMITGLPVGFIAVLGIVALIGMIARNSVILVEQIEQHRAAGEDGWSALIDATVSRARPIVLTAAAAILGMIPIAREVFWAPLAFSVIGGLTVATVLTLVFLPALYALWFRLEPQPPAASPSPPLSPSA
ncbi:efflux RND transporter permease subunit [Haematobacter genomosp. 1]|uniref:ACR family transporter n=1 Tax=Haematobacter genomosp. 1 TaxID=366618 RepID=A0A212A684_9RHOB|nr:efflux RND transporter permease subunit [Haematobacter genomosp. 1]OWJ74385.1 ACR family transporter [Haematobacter genomosp. 1]